MTEAVAQILQLTEQLSPVERADLTDRLVETLAESVRATIAATHLIEVRRRISEVETGKVALISSEEALARVRQLVTSARVAN